MDIYEATGMGAIDVEEVPRERVHFYGIIDAAPAKDAAMGRAAAARQGPGRKAERGKSALESWRHGPLRAAA